MLFTYRNLVVGMSLLLGSSGALLGCGDAEPLGPGALEVSWETSPRGCEDSGVEQINIQLTKDDVSTDNLFPCKDGEALLEDIESAEYSLTAKGLNADGATIFISETSSVKVDAESTKTVETLVLKAKPAELTVKWQFDDGSMCNAVGVSEVKVSIFDESDFGVADETFECNEGVHLFDALKGAGKYTVIVEGEGSEAKIYKGEESIELERGEEADIVVRLAAQD